MVCFLEFEVYKPGGKVQEWEIESSFKAWPSIQKEVFPGLCVTSGKSQLAKVSWLQGIGLFNLFIDG